MKTTVQWRLIVACLAVDAAMLLVMTAFDLGSLTSRIALLASLVLAGCWAARMRGRR